LAVQDLSSVADRAHRLRGGLIGNVETPPAIERRLNGLQDCAQSSACGCGERIRDGVEHPREIRADGCDGDDDDDRDQGGDEAVLDGGNACFILGETQQQSFHEFGSWVYMIYTVTCSSHDYSLTCSSHDRHG
jgi:hypothetical protein